MIPHTFEEWKNCIEKDCGIPLTRKFAQQRLKVYSNSKHPETKQFAKTYGKEHVKRVLHWFKKIENEHTK